MKEITTVLILLLSIIEIQAQSVSSILKGANNGVRIDTLISFGSKNELEYTPLTIVKGKKPGMVFTIVAGIHGYEYPPIIAVQELMQEIDPNKLQGTLLILPVANTASFYKRSPFINPIDRKNLNTAFPGSPSGSITDQLAYWITKEIIQHTDVFLDIHGGDASEDLIPFICYYNNQDKAKQTAHARQLSEASAMEYIVSYPYQITHTEPARYAFKQAVQDGKTALSIEAGKLGAVQTENVTLIKNAVYRMLDYSGIYKQQMINPKKSKIYLHNQSYIKVPQQGIFYSTVKSGDRVTKNENIGYIIDEFGHILHQITAPVNGIVLYKVGTPPVNTGETLFCIGY